jgi:hypothetical protein
MADKHIAHGPLSDAEVEQIFDRFDHVIAIWQTDPSTNQLGNLMLWIVKGGLSIVPAKATVLHCRDAEQAEDWRERFGNGRQRQPAA